MLPILLSTNYVKREQLAKRNQRKGKIRNVQTVFFSKNSAKIFNSHESRSYCGFWNKHFDMLLEQCWSEYIKEVIYIYETHFQDHWIKQMNTRLYTIFANINCTNNDYKHIWIKHTFHFVDYYFILAVFNSICILRFDKKLQSS